MSAVKRGLEVTYQAFMAGAMIYFAGHMTLWVVRGLKVVGMR